jgi:hypothetical protein
MQERDHACALLVIVALWLGGERDLARAGAACVFVCWGLRMAWLAWWLWGRRG